MDARVKTNSPEEDSVQKPEGGYRVKMHLQALESYEATAIPDERNHSPHILCIDAASVWQFCKWMIKGRGCKGAMLACLACCLMLWKSRAMTLEEIYYRSSRILKHTYFLLYPSSYFKSEKTILKQSFHTHTHTIPKDLFIVVCLILLWGKSGFFMAWGHEHKG